MTMLGDLLAGIEMWQLPLIFAVILGATLVQYTIGMGYGLAAAPLLALIEPDLVPAPVIILTVFTAFTALRTSPGAPNWSEVGIGMVGRVLGAIVSVGVLVQLTDPKGVMVLFGLFVALAVLLSVVGIRLPFNTYTLFAMGALSGMMAAVTSVGAPPMAVVYQNKSPREARPTLSAFFAVGCVVLLAVLGVGGLLSWKDLAYALLMAPAMVLGLILGPRFVGVIDRNFRPALLSVAALAATLLIARGLA